MIKICNKDYNINTTRLYLTHMNLTEIPNEVFQLKNLDTLSLSDNMINTILICI